ncbi:hypothetical protein VCRA2110O318_150046 [Vibrio crassostreae]|nr:hypothetical protein VCRA2117O328_150057 [Vibrio crassostreae]CAK2276644.1 hypothetical protein VCRA2110O318_150046 [Vibrio crassostreae]CAK2648030.1 hypothetical protein VCRA217O317_150047 [Vibrio crassostreae]
MMCFKKNISIFLLFYEVYIEKSDVNPYLKLQKYKSLFLYRSLYVSMFVLSELKYIFIY